MTSDELDTGKNKILVLDDEPCILASIQDLLEDTFEVFATTSAEQAFSALETGGFGVILSDQRMPGMTGDAFLRRAKHLSGATRLLFTGYADIDALVRALNDGQIYGYVSKPWDPVALKSTIRSAADYFLLHQSLLHERRLLHGLMESIPDAIFFKDLTSRFIRVNSAHARVLGLPSPETALGKTEFDLLPKDYAMSSYADEQRLIRSKLPLADRVERIRTPEGAQRWYSTTKAPVVDDQAHVTAIVGIARDISDRMRAEEALRESELRFRQMAESIGHVCWIIDVHARSLLYISPAFEAVWGRPVSELYQNPALFSASVHPDDREGTFRLDRDLSVIHEDVYRIIRPDGGIRYVQTRSFPVRGEGGEIRRLAGVSEDVTDRRNFEEQMRKAEKLQAIGRLAGGIAHDFNNLLTVIGGYTSRLTSQFDQDSQVARDLSMIHEAASKATALTRQLLTFSRARMAEATVLDLNQVVERMGSLLQRLVGDDIETDIRLAPSPASVRADESQIAQVVMNLAVNARDAMPAGGKLTIEVDIVEVGHEKATTLGKLAPGCHALLRVSDTGCGMDEPTRRQIFEPFFTTKSNGTGLGLATVFGVVSQNSGAISVDTRLGEGTVFEIYLPSAAMGEARSTVPEDNTAPAQPGLETILVVDDNDGIRLLTAEILKACGYRTLSASNGLEALELAGEYPGIVDLVLTDIGMPGMNGVDFSSHIRASRPDVRVVFMSGYVDEKYDMPESIVVQKPFTAEVLCKKVRQTLGETDRRPCVLVVDDQESGRRHLRHLLETAGYRVLEADGGTGCITQLRSNRVDLLITDLRVASQAGGEVIRDLRLKRPDLKVIAVSTEFHSSFQSLARELGAASTLQTPLGDEEVLAATASILSS